MSLANQIKSISYLKSSTAEAVRTVQDSSLPLFITQNGEVKIVVQDIREYERTQETLALLKILALGEDDVACGNKSSAEHTFKRVRSRAQR